MNRMNPNRCYCEMLSAMADKDHGAARGYALALQSWLADGGAYPADHLPSMVDRSVANVLRATATCPAGIEEGYEFSLVCFDCDAGMHIDSREQALNEGWSDIEFAPDLSNANYLGLCPDCRTRQDAD
jgi:hypothetical protein